MKCVENFEIIFYETENGGIVSIVCIECKAENNYENFPTDGIDITDEEAKKLSQEKAKLEDEYQLAINTFNSNKNAKIGEISTQMEILLAIVCAAVATWLTRILPVFLFERSNLLANKENTNSKKKKKK